MMLQQTQVATVIPYYERFMSLFPTLESLATASEEEALAAWQGLGYYRRLRSLKKAAHQVIESGWPNDLCDLPGIGRYTARAVKSIAFGDDCACADGNVRRVMSRLVGRTLSLQEAESASQERMGRCKAGEWNQAVMELGAMVCLPEKPRCELCPLQSDCAAFASNSQHELPAPLPRPSVVQLEHAYACFLRGDKVAMCKCSPGEWWQGLFTFPRTVVEEGESAESAVARLGLRRSVHLGCHRHTVTRHRVKLTAFAGVGTFRGAEWRAVRELSGLPLPSPLRKIANWLEVVL